MDRKSFFSQGFKLLKGQMIEQSVPQSIKVKMEEVPYRPLGVKNEADFITKCSLCEDCVSACPESVIKMVLEYDKVKRPQLIDTTKCLSCAGRECVSSCTDNALTDDHVTQVAQITLNTDNCISYMGSMCRTCFDYCPEKNKAIRLEQFVPVFDDAFCTACNKCSEMCVTGEDTIKILPYGAKE